MSILGVVLSASVLAGALPAGPEEDRPALPEILEHRQLDAIRKPDRVETFALEDARPEPGQPAPSGEPVPTDLPGDFLAQSDRIPVSADLAAELSRRLLDPASYAPWITACLFSPGVGIRFHRGSRAVGVFVCFHCRELAFQAVGAKRSYQKLSFDPMQEALFDLVKRARPADARLQKVRQEWDAQAERARKHLEAEQRWQRAMPASLRPFWKAMNERAPFGHQDLAPLQAALARESPEPRTRILALLEWYGSGDGPWSGFPAYEETAENLLLAYAVPDLLSAVDAGHLSTNQMEGAARLFAASTFQRARPGDGALLDPQLRQRLLEHSLPGEIRKLKDRGIDPEALKGGRGTGQSGYPIESGRYDLLWQGWLLGCGRGGLGDAAGCGLGGLSAIDRGV